MTRELKVFQLFAILFGIVLPLQTGCFEDTPPDSQPVCDGQPEINLAYFLPATNESPFYFMTPDSAGFVYGRRYPNLQTRAIEEIVERVEVRDSNGQVVFSILNPAEIDRTTLVTLSNLLSPGEHTLTVTLDDEAVLNSCQTNYVLTSQTLNFTISEVEPPPVNAAPIADAGPDAAVVIGESVMLDGSGSSDPEGQPLTFSWNQTEGPQVELQNADTANPSFIAPASVGTLTFELTVEDDANNTATDSVSIHTMLNAHLLVVNTTGNSVIAHDLASYDDIDGNVAPDAELVGASTGLASPVDAVINKAGELMVLNVLTLGFHSVTVYAGASDLANINGDVATIRTLQGVLLQSELENAAMADGVTVPTRYIEVPSSGDLSGVALNGNDQLFLTDRSGDSLLIFNDASTLTGGVNPDATLTMTGAGELVDVVIGPLGDGLVVDREVNAIYDFEDVVNLGGPVSPDRILAGINTQLATPNRAVVHTP
jgi:hypothetical protein